MTLKELFKSIADAIRSKEDTVELINAEDFPGRITTLPSGEPDWIKEVETMKGLFENNNTVTRIDMSSIKNINKVISLSCMFRNCRSLAEVDLSNLNTSNVTDMSNMLEGCVELTSLNLGN